MLAVKWDTVPLFTWWRGSLSLLHELPVT